MNPVERRAKDKNCFKSRLFPTGYLRKRTILHRGPGEPAFPGGPAAALSTVDFTGRLRYDEDEQASTCEVEKMSEKVVSGAESGSDAELARMVRGGDGDAFAELTARFLAMIRRKIAPLRAAGLETDDLFQEGLLGLLRAAQTYDPQRGASFRTYAGVCVSNRVIAACRAAADRKNAPLSDFISLSGADVPEVEAGCRSADPEALLDSRESFRAMCRRISSQLTPVENGVLRLYLSGYSYRGIAQRMSITEKAADNALQRARWKLRHAEPRQ